jgi:predicted  nucleic acid-binding Zn-ribbon protein
VIEYALLFALGFLAATLAGLLIAPAVQRRVVKFTEERLKATMPLSPQEVRAQKDMARAAYAVENARLSQNVVREREKHTRAVVRNEQLLAQAATIGAENAELHAQIADMNIEAGDMRSALRREELRGEQLKAALNAADRDIRARQSEIDALNRQMNHLQADLDNMKIDIATRDTTVENLKSRAGALRDERDKARDELKMKGEQTKETDLRLSREEGRARQLEARLSRELAGSADKDNVIERRIAEISRLREKVKTLTTENKDAAKAYRATGLSRTTGSSRIAPRKSLDKATLPAPIDIGALEEDVRNQGAALSDRLLASKSEAGDAALREEMADIATKMIVLTSAREGASSPVHDLISSIDPSRESGRRSLARRVRETLPGEDT